MTSSQLLYRDILLKTKRGNSHGVFSNAKPIFVITIIDAIHEGLITGNHIDFKNKDIEDLYADNYRRCICSDNELFRANSKVTPYNLPFFHLNAESYYHIKWKEGVVPPKQAESPSSRYLKENIDYTYIDNELWELLQFPEIRYDFRNALIEKFIKNRIKTE